MSYIKAEINPEGNLDTEYKCNSKREAYIIAASLVAELINTRNDYNTFCKILKKVSKYERNK